MSLSAELAIAATAALEQAINAYLKLDPAAFARFEPCYNKVIALEVDQAGVTLFCLPSAHGLRIMSQYSGKPDTIISGRPLALFKLAGGDSTDVLFAGEVTIRGNVELGQDFKRALDRIDIDWEEHLSALTGDVIAHKAGHMLRELSQWWQGTSRRMAANAREYVQDELRLNPSRDEAEHFYTGVEQLRDDVARLQARIELLAKKYARND